MTSFASFAELRAAFSLIFFSWKLHELLFLVEGVAILYATGTTAYDDAIERQVTNYEQFSKPFYLCLGSILMSTTCRIVKKLSEIKFLRF